MRRKKRSRRRWTKDEKRKLVKRARRLLASGQTCVAVAGRLDIQETSLRLWMKQYPDEAEIKPVQIIGTGGGDGICLVTPDGFRIDGLDVQSTMALLERLR